MVAVEHLGISPALQGDPHAPSLALPREVLAAMLAHVEAAYPDEACGILAGDDQRRVTRHFLAANASATPRTFSEIAPEELFTIWTQIEAHDWQMLAYFHSHPQTPAYPSPHDILWSANWPGTFYIIFSLAERASPVVRAFLIEGETVHEYRLTITDPG